MIIKCLTLITAPSVPVTYFTTLAGLITMVTKFENLLKIAKKKNTVCIVYHLLYKIRTKNVSNKILITCKVYPYTTNNAFVYFIVNKMFILDVRVRFFNNSNYLYSKYKHLKKPAMNFRYMV